MYTTKIRLRYFFLNTFLPIFVYAPLTGIVSGAAVFSFKYSADFVADSSFIIYSFISKHLVFLPLFILGLLMLSAAITALVKYNPDIKGGGIPRSEGLLRGLLTFKWLRTFLGTFFASLLGFFSGLPLGTEGPAVMLGTSLGEGVRKVTKGRPGLSRYLMTGGAGAGFAVATGAPLAGIVFILEEIHKRFSFFILMTAASSVLSAYLTASLLCNLTGMEMGLFPLSSFPALSIADIWMPLAVGAAAGLTAVLFNKSMELVDRLYGIKLKNLPRFVKIAAAVLLTGMVGLFLPGLTGTGHGVIETLLTNGIAIRIIFLLFAAKIITVILSANSGATGGLFVPVLAIGALLGGVLNYIFGTTGSPYAAFVICLAVSAFLGAVMNAPVTAVVFILEATGQYTGTLFYITAVFIAMAVASAFNTDSLNDTLLKKLLRQRYDGKKASFVLLEGIVTQNAFAVDKRAKDILWPANCLVRTLLRVNKPMSAATMVKGGEKTFHAGDKLLMQAQTYDVNALKKELEGLLGKQDFKELPDERRAS